MKIFTELNFFDMVSLKEHEGIEEERLEVLTREIKRDGYLKKSIAVDKKTLMIIDGHHRLHALKKLGCRKIPASLFDYLSPRIVILTWGKNPRFTKEQVMAFALSGKTLPARSTRHEVKLDSGETLHISEFERDVYVPIHELR